MNFIELIPSYDFIKGFVIVSAMILASLGLTSCGFSSSPGGGYVMGSTSYLREYNRGALIHSEPTPQEREELSNLIRRTSRN